MSGPATHVFVSDILGQSQYRDLLNFAIEHEHEFTTTAVGLHGAVRGELRQSRRLCDLGDHFEPIQRRVLERVPHLIEKLGVTRFEPDGVEVEIVAHENGAFYKRHIDLFARPSERLLASGDRLVSLVFYLNREPKAFSGGELRLFPNVKPGASDNEAIDIVPEHGMCIAFSSWLPHEVRPVHCPSGAFRDSRFAINCWVYRHRPSTRDAG
jgi:SM-20-related protein